MSNDQPYDAQIERVPLGPSAWEKLPIAEKAGWANDPEVYRYEESVGHCFLKKCRLSQCKPPADAFEGRLFYGAADVRWLRHPSGQFSAWITREVSNGSEQVVAVPRRYYLIGTYSRGAKPAEARYAKELDYPVRSVQTDDKKPPRAFIDVREYFSTKPGWGKSAGEVDEQLNQPLLIAHRFAGVDAGMDKGTD
jgi:hypothetical protein